MCSNKKIFIGKDSVKWTIILSQQVFCLTCSPEWPRTTILCTLFVDSSALESDMAHTSLSSTAPEPDTPTTTVNTLVLKDQIPNNKGITLYPLHTYYLTKDHFIRTGFLWRYAPKTWSPTYYLLIMIPSSCLFAIIEKSLWSSPDIYLIKHTAAIWKVNFLVSWLISWSSVLSQNSDYSDFFL